MVTVADPGDMSTETSEATIDVFASPKVALPSHDAFSRVGAAEPVASGSVKECCPTAERLKTGEKKSQVESALFAQ
jgi:hypothetical protein